MLQPTRLINRSSARLFAASALSSLALTGAAQATGQPLWGYGVQSCAAYVSAAAAPDAGELTRYQDWLTGFISGLNLATGEDALRGADIKIAMVRTQAFCKGQPDSDLFNAAMDLVRSLRVSKK